MDDVKVIAGQILQEAKKYLVIADDKAYFTDPVYPGLVRNRVNAEICKCMVRFGDVEYVPNIISYIVSCQAADGSWNEIHPNYNNPSALITAFIGEALLEAYDICPQDAALEKAYKYVSAAEKRPGYFVKSEKYTADCLNVNASCGSFLAKYGKRFSCNEALQAAFRAAKHVCECQFEDGAYPYTCDRGTYRYNQNIPCIHYQGVTMYYLQKINEILHDVSIDKSLEKGAVWLASVQDEKGYFDWKKSGLNFAYYLSGASAFAYAVFSYARRFDNKYEKNMELSLINLQRNIQGIMLRWERSSMLSVIKDVGTAKKSASLGEYPVKEHTFRFGYCMYRQISRRRYAESVNPAFFNRLCSMMKIEASTVEPFNNFRDMFMTSEVLDCLSWGVL